MFNPTYKKYLFVINNGKPVALTPDQFASMREAYNVAKDSPIPNPVKDFILIPETLFDYLCTAIIRGQGLITLHTRLSTNPEAQETAMVLTSEEYKKFLWDYKQSLQTHIDEIQNQYKQLMAEFVLISSLNGQSGVILPDDN